MVNRKRDGGNFDQATIDRVWQKVKPSHYEGVGFDVCNHVISKVEYGRETDYGWHIDHILPLAKGGGDDMANLQPLFWRSNLIKGDSYPWRCP